MLATLWFAPIKRRLVDNPPGLPLAEALCKAGTRPNVLLVMLESFRGAEVGAYGASWG